MQDIRLKYMENIVKSIGIATSITVWPAGISFKLTVNPFRLTHLILLPDMSNESTFKLGFIPNRWYAFDMRDPECFQKFRDTIESLMLSLRSET